MVAKSRPLPFLMGEAERSCRRGGPIRKIPNVTFIKIIGFCALAWVLFNIIRWAVNKRRGHRG